MFEFALSGIRSGLRGRSFQAVFVLGLVLIGVAYLSGNFSPRQPRTVTLDVGLSGLRFALVLLNLFWMQELVAKEVDRKVVLFSLAYPVPRSAFLLGRLLSCFVLSLMAAAIMGLLLLLVVIASGGGYVQEYPVQLGAAYWLTICGLVLDAAVVSAFSMCISALSTVGVLPFALGMAFAAGGKALGATLDYLAQGADGDTAMVNQLDPLLKAGQWLLPDLSRLDWRDWALYGLYPGGEAIAWGIVMAFSYVAMLSALAILVFLRREFS
ncbi:MAG: hypothetical protein QG616_774 [Pseudomonadota bacterium]|nr:hypothetical protein [Pseudomonadota bacterium]MDQ5906246.1 hypothetical protein [Pseudomonadota bacterium]MDQ5946018.1 hypothetical protein [Pseudomonadota bacterium]